MDMKPEQDQATADAANTEIAPRHTPGPWRVVERRNARGQELTPCVVGDPRGLRRSSPVAVASAISYAETNANARLIAAAPDLLEALELARSWVALRLGDTHDDLRKIDAAIAKAVWTT